MVSDALSLYPRHRVNNTNDWPFLMPIYCININIPIELHSFFCFLFLFVCRRLCSVIRNFRI